MRYSAVFGVVLDTVQYSYIVVLCGSTVAVQGWFRRQIGTELIGAVRCQRQGHFIGISARGLSEQYSASDRVVS